MRSRNSGGVAFQGRTEILPSSRGTTVMPRRSSSSSRARRLITPPRHRHRHQLGRGGRFRRPPRRSHFGGQGWLPGPLVFGVLVVPVVRAARAVGSPSPEASGPRLRLVVRRGPYLPHGQHGCCRRKPLYSPYLT